MIGHAHTLTALHFNYPWLHQIPEQPAAQQMLAVPQMKYCQTYQVCAGIVDVITTLLSSCRFGGFSTFSYLKE